MAETPFKRNSPFATKEEKKGANRFRTKHEITERPKKNQSLLWTSYRDETWMNG